MKEKFGLYMILTDPVIGYESCAEIAVKMGIRYLQLRMKKSPPDTVLEKALAIRTITKNSFTRFIVNDDVGIAEESGADGVHLGQDDMPVQEARRIWNTDGRIYGLSTHNEEQEMTARSINPDYIGVGPVFETPTKDIPDPVIGLERMVAIIQSSPLTAVAIGGIDESNLDEVLKHGAVNFCAVRAIMQSDKPEDVIARMMDTWNMYHGE